METPMSMMGYTKYKSHVSQQLRNDTANKKWEERGKKIEVE